MSGMYGADVTHLRSLAAQFDRQAQQLDAHRMTVGNAIQISAWVGPVAVRFRHQWDSQYSRQVHDAATRLHGAARDLRRNADEQDRASAADGGSGGGSGGGGYSGGGGGGGGGGGWGSAAVVGLPLAGAILKAAYDARGKVSAVLKVAKAVELVNTARLVEGVTKAGRLTTALALSGPMKYLDKASDIIALGKVGKVAFAGLGIGLDAAAAADAFFNKKDYGAGLYNLSKVALGVASLAPPPVGIAAAGVNGLLTLGELAYKHREQIAQATGAAVNAISDVSKPIVRALTDTAKKIFPVEAVGGAISSVAKAAKKLWPF